MTVSVTIPALNEGHRLQVFLQSIGTELSRAPSDTPAIELIVVDDGSRPENLALHRDAVERLRAMLAGGPHRVRLHELQRNRGKAAAVRSGWAEAPPGAHWLGFVDADGAVPGGEVVRLARMLAAQGPDVLAGSRIRMAGHVIHRSGLRHLQGRVFATAVEWLLRLGFYDPQCGLKFFAAGMLRKHLPRLRERTWLLDVEVLALLKRDGARLREEPIDWSDPGGSKVSAAMDPLKMFYGLWRLRRRLDREATG